MVANMTSITSPPTRRSLSGAMVAIVCPCPSPLSSRGGIDGSREPRRSKTDEALQEMVMTWRLELRNITKRYPSVVANSGINLAVLPGEIHAVLGENGAGKSTLMKIIYGAVQADEGEILWNGEKVEIANPAQARALGIGMVFQHFSLFESLSVVENISLAMDEPF